MSDRFPDHKRYFLFQRSKVVAAFVLLCAWCGAAILTLMPAVAADEHALVAFGVPGGGDDLQAGQHLGVAVQQLEPGAGEVEPVVQHRRLSAGPVELGALDVERGVLEHGVLATVIEVQVGVDHQADVGRAQVQLGQRAGHRAVDHAPVVEHLLRAADAGVDQHGAVVVGDHEPVYRPVAAVDALQAGQVQAPDLQAHRRGTGRWVRSCSRAKNPKGT